MKKIFFAISLLTLATLYTPAYAGQSPCGSETCPIHNTESEIKLEKIEQAFKDFQDTLDNINDLLQLLEENERARNQH